VCGGRALAGGDLRGCWQRQEPPAQPRANPELAGQGPCRSVDGPRELVHRRRRISYFDGIWDKLAIQPRKGYCQGHRPQENFWQALKTGPNGKITTVDLFPKWAAVPCEPEIIIYRGG